jgi:hypothetical protein
MHAGLISAGKQAIMFLEVPIRRVIHPSGALNFNMFQRGNFLSLGHLLRTWRIEKIPYAKLT